MLHIRTLLRVAASGAALVSLAACLDSGPTTADGAPRQYTPSFGGSGGAASTELAGIRAPSAMTCRFVSGSGRVECDPTTTSGVTFRASFQFLDVQGRPQAQRDGQTNSINERTEMLGVPTGFGTVTPGTLLFDSVSSRSDVTRRGLLDSVYTISGEHVVRTRSRLLLSATDTSAIVADASTQWRDLRYPREAVLFRPAPPTLSPGGTPLSADSINAVFRLSGAWARSGSRVDRSIATTTSRTLGSGTRSTTATLTYETPDVARVEQVVSGGSLTLRSTCRVDRLSFSAICQ